MPTLYVLVGVPGAGKSTWVRNQNFGSDYAYVSSDKYVEKFARRLGKTYTEVFNDVMQRCIRLMMRDVNRAQRLRKNIVWDQTSTTVASRKRKFVALPHYRKIAVVFKTPDKEELARRLANRPGKEIPSNVMEQMISGFVMPTIDEGFDEIITV